MKKSTALVLNKISRVLTVISLLLNIYVVARILMETKGKSSTE